MECRPQLVEIVDLLVVGAAAVVDGVFVEIFLFYLYMFVFSFNLLFVQHNIYRARDRLHIAKDLIANYLFVVVVVVNCRVYLLVAIRFQHCSSFHMFT